MSFKKDNRSSHDDNITANDVSYKYLIIVDEQVMLYNLCERKLVTHLPTKGK